ADEEPAALAVEPDAVLARAGTEVLDLPGVGVGDVEFAMNVVAGVALRVGADADRFDRDGARAVHAEAPLNDVVVMGAPVGHHPAGVFVPVAEVPVGALRNVLLPGRLSLPHVPIEPGRNRLHGEGAAAGALRQMGLGALDLADPA